MKDGFPNTVWSQCSAEIRVLLTLFQDINSTPPLNLVLNFSLNGIKHNGQFSTTHVEYHCLVVVIRKHDEIPAKMYLAK